MYKEVNVKILRQMNYFSDQKGIIRRYINEEGAWDNHFTNTKKYITDCLKKKVVFDVVAMEL